MGGSAYATSVPQSTLPFATLLKPKQSNDFDLYVAAIGTCMIGRGFKFPSPPASASASISRSPAQTRSYDAGYGVVDGMLLAVLPPNGGEPDPLGDPLGWIDDYGNTLSAGERERFFEAFYGEGSDEVGCLTQADQQASSGDVFADPTYDRIFDEYFGRLNSDPELSQQTERWRACLVERTGLLEGIEPAFPLSRNNIEEAVRADLSMRAGRSVRLVTKAEADQIDTTALDDPWELEVDATTNVGFVMAGPMDSSTDYDALVEREVEVRNADTDCWQQSGGDKRVAELQAETLEQIENLQAAQS